MKRKVMYGLKIQVWEAKSMELTLAQIKQHPQRKIPINNSSAIRRSNTTIMKTYIHNSSQSVKRASFDFAVLLSRKRTFYLNKTNSKSESFLKLLLRIKLASCFIWQTLLKNKSKISKLNPYWPKDPLLALYSIS